MSKKLAFSVAAKSRKKNGKKGEKQLYKCYVCGCRFVDTNCIDAAELNCGICTAVVNKHIFAIV